MIRATACTGNPHKLDEFRALFPDWDLELLAGAEFPPEDGLTFEDNARIKVRYGRLVGPADRWMLADDSGIEVAALGGGPGVQTARWAEGRHVEKLLAAVNHTGTAHEKFEQTELGGREGDLVERVAIANAVEVHEALQPTASN